MVSGGTGSGKTTLLNALSAFIPERERIVTIEDAAELSLQQSHVIRLESRPANVEGRGQVTIRELVRNSLRMRPDRIVVGEVRGGETMDMLSAMNTGHEGSLTTVHANSPDDALSRLETLASMSDLEIPFAGRPGAGQQRHRRDRAARPRTGRVAGSVASSREPGVPCAARSTGCTTVSRFEADPIGPDRIVRGRHVARPLTDALDRRLAPGRRAAPRCGPGGRGTVTCT